MKIQIYPAPDIFFPPLLSFRWSTFVRRIQQGIGSPRIHMDVPFWIYIAFSILVSQSTCHQALAHSVHSMLVHSYVPCSCTLPMCMYSSGIGPISSYSTEQFQNEKKVHRIGPPNAPIYSTYLVTAKMLSPLCYRYQHFSRHLSGIRFDYSIPLRSLCFFCRVIYLLYLGDVIYMLAFLRYGLLKRPLPPPSIYHEWPHNLQPGIILQNQYWSKSL